MFCEKNRSLRGEIRVSAMNMTASFQTREGISLLLRLCHRTQKGVPASAGDLGTPVKKDPPSLLVSNSSVGIVKNMATGPKWSCICQVRCHQTKITHYSFSSPRNSILNQSIRDHLISTS